MKDKLLKLIEACINDDKMFDNSDRYAYTTSFEGIAENTTKLDLSAVVGIAVDKKTIFSINPRIGVINDSTYDFGLERTNTKIQGYDIVFGFGNQPQILIRKIRKNSTLSQIKSIGTRQTWLTKRPMTFDVTIEQTNYHYEMRCGSYAYIISDEQVETIYNSIKTKRTELARKAELKEINSRFEKYKI